MSLYYPTLFLPPFPNTTSNFNLATPTGSSGSSRAPEAEDETTSVVYTTTLADGAISVTTAIRVVPADQVTKSTGSGGASTRTANASLQTDLGNSQYQLGGWAAGMGVLGMAAAWAL